MNVKRSIRPCAAAIALGFAVAGLSTPAMSAVSEKQAAKMVAETFDVQVLRVRAGQVGDRPGARYPCHELDQEPESR